MSCACKLPTGDHVVVLEGAVDSGTTRVGARTLFVFDEVSFKGTSGSVIAQSALVTDEATVDAEGTSLAETPAGDGSGPAFVIAAVASPRAQTGAGDVRPSVEIGGDVANELAKTTIPSGKLSAYLDDNGAGEAGDGAGLHDLGRGQGRRHLDHRLQLRRLPLSDVRHRGLASGHAPRFNVTSIDVKEPQMPETAAKPADVSSLASRQISYADLYERWEQGNWKATAIDFSADRAGWEALTDIQRSSALWIYSMFFYGEDSVTDNLSPYIDAAPREEQKYFLATQQVDEARHSVFFARFFREVIGVEGDYSAGLAYTLPQLNWGYRQVFDRLDRMADELRADRSLPKFAQAIALYHMVVEATLAQPGQHFIEDFFTREGTMPGFSEGMKNVSRDEQRHIGFGVKTLSECFAETDECKAAVDELMREVLPMSMGVFVPPNWDREYTRCYGFEIEDIYAFGMRSVETKWRAAGYPITEMPLGRLPARLRAVAGGARGGRDQAAPGRRHRPARRRPRLLAGDAADALRRHGPLGRPLGGERQAAHDPVALHRRGALAPADRQRLDRRRAGRGAEARPHLRDELARLDRGHAPGAATRAGRCFSVGCAPGATRWCC